MNYKKTNPNSKIADVLDLDEFEDLDNLDFDDEEDLILINDEELSKAFENGDFDTLEDFELA